MMSCLLHTASAAQPGRVGHARQAVLHGRGDPRVGHRLLRAAADGAGGRSQVSLRIFFLTITLPSSASLGI